MSLDDRLRGASGDDPNVDVDAALGATKQRRAQRRARRRALIGGLGAALIVVALVAVNLTRDDKAPTVTAGPDTSSDGLPPSGSGAARLWISTPVVPPAGANVAVVIVNPSGSVRDIQHFATVHEWTGAAWEPRRETHFCSTAAPDCRARLEPYREGEHGFDAHGFSGRLGPVEFLRIDGLPDGVYRIARGSANGIVAAVFRVGQGADPATLLPDDAAPQGLTVVPALVAAEAAGATNASVKVQLSTEAAEKRSTDFIEVFRADRSSREHVWATNIFDPSPDQTEFDMDAELPGPGAYEVVNVSGSDAPIGSGSSGWFFVVDPSELESGPSAGSNEPVPTSQEVVLLSDGIDGIVTLDPENKVVVRSPVDGERAGDQVYRLTRTAEGWVAGWGDVFLVPFEDGPTHQLGEDVTFVPAAEEGEVWLRSMTDDKVTRVAVADGSWRAQIKIPAGDFPIIGVDGGLLIQTAAGVAIADAKTGDIGPVLGPGKPATAVSNGHDLLWCNDTCANSVRVDLPEQYQSVPTPVFVSPEPTPALDPTGTKVASVNGGTLQIRDLATGRNQVTTDLGLSDDANLAFSLDGKAVYAAQRGGDGVEIKRVELDGFDVDTFTFAHNGPVGIAVAPVKDVARYVPDTVGEPSDCAAIENVYPSGRTESCAFHL